MGRRRFLWFPFGVFAALAIACSAHSVREEIPLDWEQSSYIERGQYLVNYLGYCVGCHTPLGQNGEPDKTLFLSGVPAKFVNAKEGPPQVAGFPGPRGARFYAKNITPDPETGIGQWTEEQFVRTFRTGVRWDGSRYAISPMEWNVYSNMKEEDLRAIYRYLRTIKPISNRVPPNILPK